VILGVPHWTLGGLSSFVANLARGLLAEGVRAQILWTRHDRVEQKQLAVPPDLPLVRLPLPAAPSLGRRWRTLIRYLEERAPCVYVPNHDYLHSCVAPRLSRRVAVVGNLHSDCEEQYEHLRLQGRYWNAVVSGSGFMAEKAASLYPAVAGRMTVIPYGVDIPPTMPARSLDPAQPLRILYTGRLVQWDKRVLDLPKIVEALHARRVPVRLTITGKGMDEDALKAACRPWVDKGLIRFLGLIPDEEVPRTYEQNDVFLLTSNHEGKPLSLVEAMGRGCVPVVTDVPSGVPELVHEGVSGYRVPVGAIDAFADRLAALHADPALRLRLAKNAFAVVDQGGYRVRDMTRQYLELFRRVRAEAEGGVFRRPWGRMVLPSIVRAELHLSRSWKDYLPQPVRWIGSRCKRLVRRFCVTNSP
jgi:glycosyltransferase involved in cell wall biosynthesis